MDLAPHEIEQQYFAVIVLGEADQTDRGAGQLDVIGHLAGFAVVTKHPDPARVEIAVDIGASQLLEALAVIDVSARQRAEIGVRMLDDRLEDRRRPFLAFGPERMRPFHDAPAIVAALLDLVDTLPEVLANFADPEIARLAIEAELPGLTEAIGPGFRHGALVIEE